MYINEELEKKIINKIFNKKIQNESIELVLGVLGGLGFLGFLLYLFFKNPRTINHQYVSDSYSEPNQFKKIETSVDDFKQEIPTLNIEPNKKRDITKDVEKIEKIDTELKSIITDRNKTIDIILNILNDEKKAANKKIDFVKIKEFLQSIKEGYQGAYLQTRIQSIKNQKRHIGDTRRSSYEKQTFDLQAIIEKQSEKLRELKDVFAKININLPENSKFITMHDLHFGPKSYQKIEQIYDQKIKTSESLIFSVKLKKIKDLEFKIEDIELTDISKGNLFYNKKSSFFQFFNEEGSYELDEVDEDYFMSILSSKKIIFSKFKSDSEHSEETFEDEDLNPYESIEPKENIEFFNDDVEDLNEKNAKTNEYEKLLEDSIKKIKSNLNDQKQFLLDNYSDNSDPEILEIISNYNNGIDEELKNLSDIDIKKTSLDPLLVDDMIEDIIDANDNWNKEFNFITNAIKNKIGIRVDNTNQEKPGNNNQSNESPDLENIVDNIDEKSAKEHKETIESNHKDLISFLNRNKENILKKYKNIKNPKIEEQIEDFIENFIGLQKNEILKIEVDKIVKNKKQLKDYLEKLISKKDKFQEIIDKFYDNIDKILDPKSTSIKEEETPLSLTISKIEKNEKVGMPISFDLKNKKIKLLDENKDSKYYIVFLPGKDQVKEFEIYSTENENFLNVDQVDSDFILESIEKKYSYKIYEGHYILVKNTSNKIDIKLQLLMNSSYYKNFSELQNLFEKFEKDFEERKKTLEEEIKKHKNKEIIEKINEYIKYIDDVILAFTKDVQSPFLNNEKIKDLIDNFSNVLKQYDDIIKDFFKTIKEKEKTLLQEIIDTLSVKEKEIRVKVVSHPIKIKDDKIIFIKQILNEDDEFYIQFNPTDYDMGQCQIYSKEEKEIFDDNLLKNPESILFESKSHFKHIIYEGNYEIKDNKIILKMLVYNTQKKDENNIKDSKDLIPELDNKKKIIKKIDELEIDDNFKNFTQEILSIYYNNFIINKINNPNYKNLIKLDSEHQNNFVKNDKIIYNRNNNKISLGFKFKIETIGGKIDHNIYFFDQDKKDFIPYDTKYFIQYDNPSHKFNLIEILRFLYSTSVKKDIDSLLNKNNFINYSILFINDEEINNHILSKIKDDPYIETKKQEKTIDKKVDLKPSIKSFGFLQELTTTPNKQSKLELLENIDSPSELNMKLNLDKKVYFYIKNTVKPNEQLFYIEINKNNFKPLLQYLKNNKKFRDIKTIRNNYFSDTFNELAELSNTIFTTMSDDYKIETENIPVFGVINIEKGEYKKSSTFLPEDIILTPKQISHDESYFWGESFERTLIKKYFSNKK